MENQGLTTFSGCDIVLYLNEEVVGEMQEIQFEENLLTGEVNGFIDVVVFSKSYEKLKAAFVSKGDKDILIRYKNEQSGEMSTFVKNVEFITRKVVNKIDEHYIGHRYFFKAYGVDDQFIS